MATILKDISRTFDEFLLLPNLSTKECIPSNVSLSTGIVKHKVGEESSLTLTIPLVSAAMQAVSNDKFAIALAKNGGLSFIYCSQSIQDQAKMIKYVKSYKSGFVVSDSNLNPKSTIQDAIDLIETTRHSTIAITSDGSGSGKLLGILTDKDFRVSRVDRDSCVENYMTPFSKIFCGYDGITLKEANNIIWENKVNCVPIIDDNQNLKSLVFRKDYDVHKNNIGESVDASKKYMVGAAVNTRDYKERIPALVEAGVDVLCIDSSDGYSEWQRDVIQFVRQNYDHIKIGAGNVVTHDGFRYLVDAGADFIKVGIGGGSICITREQKGIGRGQASALIDIVAARDAYAKETGIYIPICSDGGTVTDTHITLALAMGADFVMMGRYFARFDESPSEIIKIRNNYYKEYWGEGSNRARNWQRYDMGGNTKLHFEEGVDSYVTYAGSLNENLDKTLYKVKSTLCNCGSLSLSQLREKAILTLVSELSIREGGSHDVIQKNIE